MTDGTDLSIASIVAVICTTLAATAPGFSPGSARAAPTAARVPASTAPGLCTSYATDS